MGGALAVGGVNLSPALAAAVEDGYRAINNDPRVLLETAGGPVGRNAHVVVARLYGFDEQVDDEVRLRRAEPEVLVPIFQRSTLASPAPDTPLMPRAARYVLQSSYAAGAVVAEKAPEEEHDEAFLVQFLCLRYKRTA